MAHAAVSIHLLEDQLRLSPARIEGVKNQASKYEINICFLEPSGFEGIAAKAEAWKKFINDQAGRPLFIKYFKIFFVLKFNILYKL